MLRKVKILHLLPSLRRASTTLGTLALIKYLDRERLDITVVSLDKLPIESFSIAGDLEALGVRVESLDMHGWLGLARPGNFKKFIDEEDFDIIHSCGLRPDIVNSLINKKSISVSSVREIISGGYRLQYGPIIAGIFSFVHIRALKKMDFVIAISSAIEDYLKKKGLDESKIRCIRNFVDLARTDIAGFKDIGSGNKAVAEVINVGYIGNFIPLKRVDWIIRAAADLLKNHRDLKLILHLVGDGSLRTRLEVMTGSLGIDSHVKFHGHINNIATVLNELDLVVMASRFEGIPRVLMEAMSAGKTCIGPRIGGVDELIEDEKTGYLFNPHSYRDLVRKLEKVVVGRKFLEPMRIRERVLNNFDARAGSKKTQELYEGLAAHRAILNKVKNRSV